MGVRRRPPEGMLSAASLSGNHEKASVGRVVQAERDMDTPKMSPLALRTMEAQVPGPEEVPSGESCEVCGDLSIAFQRLLLEHPAIHRPGMAALRFSLDMDLSWICGGPRPRPELLATMALV